MKMLTAEGNITKGKFKGKHFDIDIKSDNTATIIVDGKHIEDVVTRLKVHVNHGDAAPMLILEIYDCD